MPTPSPTSNSARRIQWPCQTKRPRSRRSRSSTATSEASFGRPPVWRPRSRRNSASTRRSRRGRLACLTSTWTNPSSTLLGERAVACRRTRMSSRGCVISSQIPLSRRKGKPPERVKARPASPKEHREASAVAAEGLELKPLVIAARCDTAPVRPCSELKETAHE